MESDRIIDPRHAHAIPKPDSSREAFVSPAALHPIIALQQSVGNAQVARMLAQREALPEEDEDMIQTSRTEASPAAEVGLDGGPISAGLANRITSLRGGGASLDDGNRQSMESAFGASFADVRVHTGAEAEALNRSVSSHAFTTGSDIFFGHNASPSDQNLLAHELTHVVQQREATGGGSMTVTAAGDAHEQEAEAVSSSIASSLSRARAQPDEGDF